MSYHRYTNIQACKYTGNSYFEYVNRKYTRENVAYTHEVMFYYQEALSKML